MLLKKTLGTLLSAIGLLSVSGFASAQTSVDIPDPAPLAVGTGTVSVRVENVKINNEPYEEKVRLGVTNGINLGYSRSQKINGNGRNADLLNAHIGLNQLVGLNGANNQVSFGFVHYDTRSRGFHPVYYAEDGVTIMDKLQLVGGDVYTDNGTNEGLVGAIYQLNPSLKLRVNYRSGRENFTRTGFVYTLGKSGVVVEPQLLVSNRNRKDVYGYVSVGYAL